jgi:hypothetical protein
LSHCLIEGEKPFIGNVGGEVKDVHVEPFTSAAVAKPALAASVLDLDAPHRLGGGSEEVAPAVPGLSVAAADQAQIGFVNKCGGIERLAGLFLGHLVGREPAQLVIDQRQELLGGVRVALVDGGKDPSDIGHELNDNGWKVSNDMAMADLSTDGQT